jgi:hypothetical protein
MRGFLKPAALFAAGALAVAVPATAKQPPHPAHPSHPSQAQGGGGNDNGTRSNSSSSSGSSHGKGHHNGKSHKCVAHNVAYIASGTLVSFAATQNSDGTYTGTITVHVTRTNHHGATDRNSDVTYTLTNARVRFGKGTSATDTGPDRVKVIGRITTLARRCDQTGFTPTVTVRRVDVRKARSTS